MSLNIQVFYLFWWQKFHQGWIQICKGKATDNQLKKTQESSGHPVAIVGRR